MSLISCPECGKQISDRAVLCPDCGCPIAAEEYTVSAPISSKPSPQLVLFCELTGSSFRYASNGIKTAKVYRKDDAERIVDALRERGIAADCSKSAGPPEPPGTVHCPYCGSASVQMVKRGFGVGKAVAGAFIAGPVGLAAGVIGSWKLDRVCAACGKRF